MRFIPPSVSSYLPITLIVNEPIGVQPMSAPRAMLFALDLNRLAQKIADTVDHEIVEKLLEDVYSVPKRIDRSQFPHRCPRCGEAAYVGLNTVDCSKGCI